MKTSLMVALFYFTTMSCGELPKSHSIKSAWDFANAPERMGILKSDLNFHFSDLPKKSSLSKKPWSGGYWPNYLGGISYRWNYSRYSEKERVYYEIKKPSDYKDEDEINQLSPAEKFDLLVDNYRFDLTEKERKRTSVMKQLKGEKIPTWYGLCHAWAPATLLYENPNPISLKNSNGVEIAFGSSDIKALLTYYLHEKSSTTHFVSRRCNVDDIALKEQLEKGTITYDEYADKMDSAECEGINAGAFHILLTNMIGLKDEGFIADVTRGQEVWNQAVHGYQSKVIGKKQNNFSKDAAKGTVKEIKIATTMYYTIEVGTSWELEKNPDSNASLSYTYWLELDESDNIIGGSWVSEERPDFLWNMSKPIFSEEDKILQNLYEKSTGDLSHRKEFVDSKNIKLVWSLKRNKVKLKLKIEGNVSSEVDQIKIFIWDEKKKLIQSNKVDINYDGSFEKEISTWSWKPIKVALVSYNRSGQKISEHQKSLNS